MVLFRECLKEFEAGDEEPGKVNIFPFSTEVLQERVKLLKHQAQNLVQPMESKININLTGNHQLDMQV